MQPLFIPENRHWRYVIFLELFPNKILTVLDKAITNGTEYKFISRSFADMMLQGNYSPISCKKRVWALFTRQLNIKEVLYHSNNYLTICLKQHTL